MREIKFRAWQDNQMLTQPMSGVYAAKRFFGMLYEDTELMQYTGLKDKNGVEIYEGDVVEWEDRTADDMYGGDVIYPNEAVEFKGAAFYPVSMMPGEEFEVIGNIYENKQLLD